MNHDDLRLALQRTSLARLSGWHVERGFTLLEVLVALVLLSVGVLGAAALGLDAVRTHRQAAYRAQAVRLASDMAERVSINRTGLPAYGTAPQDHGCGSGNPVPCDPEQMAASDLHDWLNLIAATLPQGSGRVSPDSERRPAVCRITVQWREQAKQLTEELEIYL